LAIERLLESRGKGILSLNYFQSIYYSKNLKIAYIMNSFMASNNYNIDQKHKNQPEFKKNHKVIYTLLSKVKDSMELISSNGTH
jgi:hypothetical protein